MMMMMMLEWMESKKGEGVGGTKAHLFICSRRGLRLPGLGVAMDGPPQTGAVRLPLVTAGAREGGARVFGRHATPAPTVDERRARAHRRGPKARLADGQALFQELKLLCSLDRWASLVGGWVVAGVAPNAFFFACLPPVCHWTPTVCDNAGAGKPPNGGPAFSHPFPASLHLCQAPHHQ